MPTGDREDSPQRLTWRLDALDSWRSELEGRMAVIESKVSNIVFDDRLAQALTKKLEERTTHHFTLWQKALAVLVSLVVVAGGIKTLLGL